MLYPPHCGVSILGASLLHESLSVTGADVTRTACLGHVELHGNLQLLQRQHQCGPKLLVKILRR